MIGSGRWLAAWAALASAASGGGAAAQTRAAGEVTTRETRAAPDADPAAFAVVDFLSGGAVRASGLTVPAASAVSTEPPWLLNWRQALDKAAQPARAGRDLALHPLGRVAPAVLAWPDRPSVDPASPATAAWADLACPPAAAARVPPIVYTQVAVVAETADGWPTLGVQLACVSAQSRLLAVVRAAVQTDTRGVVRSAQAVRWVGDRPLPAATGRGAQPEWPIRPAPLRSRKPAWVLPGGHGWLVQVQHDPSADWQDDGVSLPAATPAIATTATPQRAVWWFDRSGKLRQALMTGGDGSRQPPDGDGASEFETGELPGLFVVQRMSMVAGEHAGTRTGYAAWHLAGDGARAWRVDLPELPTPGLWHCLGHGQPLSLHCQFASLADSAVPRGTAELVLIGQPAQRAFLRPKERR